MSADATEVTDSKTPTIGKGANDNGRTPINPNAFFQPLETEVVDSLIANPDHLEQEAIVITDSKSLTDLDATSSKCNISCCTIS